MTLQHPLSDDVASCMRDMKRDWDDRARRDAMWFINTLKAGQSDAEFDESGRRETSNLVLALLDVVAQGRDPGSLSMLEPSVVVGGRRVRAESVTFVPGNGCHMIELSLPRGIGPGEMPIYVEAGGMRSAPELMRVDRTGSVMGGVLRRAKLATAALFQR
ncbi:MAG: hypothetical protein ACYC5O_11545 [Anaerolineae bacterium]